VRSVLSIITCFSGEMPLSWKVVRAHFDGLISNSLVKNGWWWYRKYAPGDLELEKLEKKMRDAKKGLWDDPKPVPP
jgi:endonuclease YncB( thermonuclease family)